MTNPEAFAAAIVNALVLHGYQSPKCTVEIIAGGYGNSNVSVTWRDLMDEYCSHYDSVKAGDTLESVYARVRTHILALPPARDALDASAAAMVQRCRQKLLDAGFEGEAWMTEMESIVKTLSANALTHEA